MHILSQTLDKDQKMRTSFDTNLKDTVAIPEFLKKSRKILKQGFLSDAIMLDLSRFSGR